MRDLARVVKEAFFLARTGRPGPVVIDLPKDVTAATWTFSYPETVSLPSYRPAGRGDPRLVRRAVGMMVAAERPIVYAGGGIVNAGAAAELLELSERLNLPVTPTLILIALGSRFDDRVTGRLKDFAPDAQVIHVDVDPSSINKNRAVEVGIVGDARLVLRQMLDCLDHEARLEGPPPRDAWWNTLRGWAAQHPYRYKKRPGVIMPQAVIEELHRLTGGEAIVTADVGQHQMWVAQYYGFRRPRQWLNSGGLGTMGYGFPAAIGAAKAHPDRTVVCVTGDGSFQMCIQEMATAVQEKVNVKVVVINNNYLGMVRQWQELFYSRTYSEVGLEWLPDFVRLAEAYHATGLRASKPEELRPVLEKGLGAPGPVVMDMIVSQEESVYPMVPAGASLREMVLEPPDDPAEGPEPRDLA